MRRGNMLQSSVSQCDAQHLYIQMLFDVLYPNVFPHFLQGSCKENNFSPQYSSSQILIEFVKTRCRESRSIALRTNLTVSRSLENRKRFEESLGCIRTYLPQNCTKKNKGINCWTCWPIFRKIREFWSIWVVERHALSSAAAIIQRKRIPTERILHIPKLISLQLGDSVSKSFEDGCEIRRQCVQKLVHNPIVVWESGLSRKTSTIDHHLHYNKETERRERWWDCS